MSPEKPLARLLIVDDEAAQMKALCQTLEERGYVTVGFSSAKQAITALVEQHFDLLLTDLMMPELDGISLLRQAQEIDPSLVGIVMTGHATVDSAVDAMRTGALDYILKPFKLSAILPVLTRALAVRKLRVDNEALQKSLRARTQELEAANKDLESFSYSVSHDLRAPLRGIDGFSQILLRDFGPELPPEAQRLLGKVVAQAAVMQQLVEDLLRFSRLGRQALSKREVDMAELVDQAVAQLRTENEGRVVEVKVGALPQVQADPALLKQVMVNLLSNAFKFTRGRKPAVIEAGGEEKGDERVFFVRDNGAGFDMAYADKLFGVFQRLHSAQEFEGTGIGLSIVHRIIQRHGGRTWAEGKPGEGATFYFSLPKPSALEPGASQVA